MPTWKMVNTDQLDADLTSVADAIRTKGGTSDSLLFPSEFVNAVGAIQTGVQFGKYITTFYRLFKGATNFDGDFVFDITGTDPTNNSTWSEIFNNITTGTMDHLIIKGFVRTVAFSFNGAFKSNSIIKKLSFVDCDFAPTDWGGAFQWMANCEEIEGELDFSNATSVSSIFYGSPKLKEIRFKANTLSLSISLAQSNLLSDDTLVSIANGLNGNATGQTLTLHATPKARCSTLMGNNNSGTFEIDAGGTMSLSDFITTVKGWTLA